MIKRHKLAIAIFLVAALVATVWIVLSPERPAAHDQEELRLWINRAHKSWLPTLISFGVIEWFANVIMFLPLGLLGQALVNRWYMTLGSAVLLSCVVELAQTFLLPRRFGSVADVLANSFGAALGIGLYLLLRKQLRASAAGGKPNVD